MMKIPQQMRTRPYVAVLVALSAAIGLWWCGGNAPQYRISQGVVWTTEYHITYESRHDLNDSVARVLQAVDNSLSVFNKRSLVSSLNNNVSDSVDGLFTLVFDCAAAVHRLSGGVYDPTVMPLVNAWGYGFKLGALPDARQIDSLLAFVGMDKVRVADNRLVKDDPRVQLDFSSIAKGLAVDLVGRMFERNGVENYLVEIGGEVLAIGRNERHLPWHVSVDLPTDQADTVSHDRAVMLAIDHCGVATSGNYRRYNESGGKRLSHIVDPRTGHNRVGTLLSATVVARDCMTADAWATACMVLGDDGTKQLMADNDTLGVMTICADTTGVEPVLVVWSNKRFADFVVPVKR